MDLFLEGVAGKWPARGEVVKKSSFLCYAANVSSTLRRRCSIFVASTVALSAILVGEARASDGASSSDDAAAVIALDELQLASAAPDATLSAFGWRNGVRGRVGIAMPVVDESRWLVRVHAAIEVYNDGGSEAFPYQYWRGMLGARVTRRWALPPGDGPRALALGMGIEHESDHETYHGPPNFHSFVYTDSLSARGDLLFAWRELTLLTEVTLRGHFLDCTDVNQWCGGNLETSASLEGDFDVMARTAGLPIEDGSVRACGAMHFGYVAPNGSIVREARAALDLGACLRSKKSGEWELMGESRVGSDVGLHRWRNVAQLGLSVRWII